MSKNVYHESYHPDALVELEEVSDQYERDSIGLGYAFFREVDKAIEFLLEFPESVQVIHPSGVRRKLLKRFPYAVLYRLKEDTLLVVAIMHVRRRPDYWVYRLEE